MDWLNWMDGHNPIALMLLTVAAVPIALLGLHRATSLVERRPRQPTFALPRYVLQDGHSHTLH